MLLPGEDDGTDIFKGVSVTGDQYEDYPDDEDKIDVHKIDLCISAAKEIREFGNNLFKEGKYEEALKQYRSEFRQALL